MQLEIFIYNTYFKIRCDKFGWIVPNELKIEKFLWNLTESQWNPRTNRWVTTYRYCYFDKKTSMLHLPRYSLGVFLEYINGYDYVCTNMPAGEAREINIRLKPKIEDKDNQVDLVEYLSDPNVPVKLLEATTGIGKTYCSIKASLVVVGEVTLIQTSGLVDQWKKEVLKFTKINEKDIYILQGVGSILKLLKNKKLKPKCFIASTKTLYQYALANKYPYDSILPYEEFLLLYGIGNRVVDEVHMNFFSNVIIDLKSNVNSTIDLSATYGRSSKSGNKIFNLIYPESLRFGSHHVQKYTKVFMYDYALSYYLTKVRLIGENGYMQCKYELAMCKHQASYDTFMNQVLYPLIQSHYVNYALPGEKLLILAYTRNMVEAIYNDVCALFPQYKTISFLGEDDDEKHDNCDIIISTMKSSGTGRDIKKLITTINTASFKADTLTRQCLGRLRKMKDRDTIFVDMYNRELYSHCEHKRIRSGIYQSRALTYYETRIN